MSLMYYHPNIALKGLVIVVQLSDITVNHDCLYACKTLIRLSHGSMAEVLIMHRIIHDTR